jgi:hypothetical protein
MIGIANAPDFISTQFEYVSAKGKQPGKLRVKIVIREVEVPCTPLQAVEELRGVFAALKRLRVEVIRMVGQMVVLAAREAAEAARLAEEARRAAIEAARIEAERVAAVAREAAVAAAAKAAAKAAKKAGK